MNVCLFLGAPVVRVYFVNLGEILIWTLKFSVYKWLVRSIKLSLSTFPYRIITFINPLLCFMYYISCTSKRAQSGDPHVCSVTFNMAPFQEPQHHRVIFASNGLTGCLYNKPPLCALLTHINLASKHIVIIYTHTHSGLFFNS